MCCLVLLSSCREERGGDPEVDRDMLADGSNGSLAIEQTLAISDDLLAFDPVLDGSMSADANAIAIEANARASLGACGAVSRSGTSITVDFASGCTLPSGLTASGSVTVAIAVASGTATATITFVDLVAGAYTIDGTASFATTNGTSYDVTIDVTSGGREVLADLTIRAMPGSFTASGSATIVHGGATWSMTITGLVWVRGDCYPSAGSITIGSAALAQTLTFTAATASSGQVMVTQGRRTTTEQLPAYGECPTS